MLLSFIQVLPLASSSIGNASRAQSSILLKPGHSRLASDTSRLGLFGFELDARGVDGEAASLTLGRSPFLLLSLRVSLSVYSKSGPGK